MISADVLWLALRADKLLVNRIFVRGQGFGYRREYRLQLGILVLRGQCLRPIPCQIEMGATVVDLSNLTRGRLIVLQEASVSGIERFGQYRCLGVVLRLSQMLEGNRQRQEFTQRVPPQVSFGHKLLDVLGSGTACARLEKTAAIHQWNDREHLGRCAEFQNREQIRQIIPQYVARDGDGVCSPTDTFQG